MTFEKEFPNLKDKICIADGIQGVTTFNLRNATDLEHAKEILSRKYIYIGDVEKHCLDKEKVNDEWIKLKSVLPEYLDEYTRGFEKELGL